MHRYILILAIASALNALWAVVELFAAFNPFMIASNFAAAIICGTIAIIIAIKKKKN